MKRFLAAVALVAAGVAGIDVLADATQNRPDVRIEGSVTTIDFTVDTKRYQRGDAAAANALWTVCSATVGGTVDPVPQPHDGGWRVTVSPAIGENGESRLVGCLEDTTLDRVVGRVVAFRSTG